MICKHHSPATGQHCLAGEPGNLCSLPCRNAFFIRAIFKASIGGGASPLPENSHKPERRYKVTAFYPSFPGLHPLDDAPNRESVVVQATTESRAVLDSIRDGKLPVAFSQRDSGQRVAIFWRPGIYGTQNEPAIVDSSPSEIVLGFGPDNRTHRLTLSVFPTDEAADLHNVDLLASD